VRGILLDLDGVLYVGDEAVPGAADAIAWLRQCDVPHLFVTNTSSRPRAAIVDKLARFGIEARAEQILTPAAAAAAWLQESDVGRPALFVPDETASEFADLDPLPADSEKGAGCVVVGDLGHGWDFGTLNRAFRLLMGEPRAVLVALGMTRYWQAADGLQLDAGAFVRALEYASGATAVVTGKPDQGFYDRAVQSLGVPKSEVVMVGDDIRSDVDGAQQAGLTGVLVRTGKYSDADLDSGVVPQSVLDSVADLPDWWSSQHTTEGVPPTTDSGAR
jgi:phospholysine phosphohistidine inorganic pyrophosphate phosphatase